MSSQAHDEVPPVQLSPSCMVGNGQARRYRGRVQLFKVRRTRAESRVVPNDSASSRLLEQLIPPSRVPSRANDMDDIIAPWTQTNADEASSPYSSPVELDLDVILQSFLDAYQKIGSLPIHSRKHADYEVCKTRNRPPSCVLIFETGFDESAGICAWMLRCSAELRQCRC